MKYGYHMRKQALSLAMAGLLAAGFFSGCGGTAAETGQGVTEAGTPTAGVESVFPSASAAPVSQAVDTEGATVLTLSGDSAAAAGRGVKVSGSEILISGGGTYSLIGGLTDGRILINAKGEDVVLVLNGVDIKCSYGSPIYCYKAASLTLELSEGTENVLTDGSAYSFSDEYSSAEEDEPNACLYSKGDLVIQGSGSLTVNGNYRNGITGKDTLEIIGASVTVNAVHHGITGKDSADISGASLAIRCEGDALRSTKTGDSALGWVRLTDTVLSAAAGGDGVSAETALRIDGGSYTIVTGGGHGNRPSDSSSTKGLKAGGDISVSSGSIALDCSDDAVHADSGIYISGGVWSVSTYDDAFHSDGTVSVSDGTITVDACYEGLEGTDVTVSGGSIRLTSSDDAINVSGGGDQSGFGGFGGFGGGMWDAVENGSLTISGGQIFITAGGDGLDSNGNISMTGGTVVVSSSGNADGALDYNGTFTLSGGTLLAMGGGMPEAPNDAGQNILYAGLGTTLSKGTVVALEGAGRQIVFELPVNASTFIYSDAELEAGADYTISYGGTYSGEFIDCIGTGGSYSGGSEIATVTLSEGLTTYGSAGFGFGPGGMGGQNGMRPGGMGGRNGMGPGGMGGRNGMGPGDMGDRNGMGPGGMDDWNGMEPGGMDGGGRGPGMENGDMDENGRGPGGMGRPDGGDAVPGTMG